MNQDEADFVSTQQRGILDGLARLPERTILDDRALAAAFGVSTRTVKRWVQRGQLPAPAAMGGRKVWLAGRILAFVEARAVEAEASAHRLLAATERAQTP